MSGLRNLFGDLPMRGIWFAPHGTPLPADAWSPLHKDFTPDMPREEDTFAGYDDWSPRRVFTPTRFATMTIVFDAGTASERARLVLSHVQVMPDGHDGRVATWMVTPTLRRHLEKARTRGRLMGDQQSARSATVSEPRAARPALRDAAVAARQAGMGVGDIIDDVSEALTAWGREERRAKVRAAMLAYLTRELGDVLQPRVLDEVAVGLAEQAQQLADEGVLFVREFSAGR